MKNKIKDTEAIAELIALLVILRKKE